MPGPGHGLFLWALASLARPEAEDRMRFIVLYRIHLAWLGWMEAASRETRDGGWTRLRPELGRHTGGHAGKRRTGEGLGTRQEVGTGEQVTEHNSQVSLWPALGTLSRWQKGPEH